MANELNQILTQKITLLLVFLSVFVFSQENRTKRAKGFQFNINSFAMLVADKNDEDIITTVPNKVYMDKSRLYGVNFEAHYRFDEYLIVGLGTGYEQISNPVITYIPFYISLKTSIDGGKLETPFFRLDLGTHFGDLAKNGALLRVGVGYRLPVYKMFCLNIEGLMTYQGIRKELEEIPDVIQEYNMLGFGIGVGIEL